MTILTPYRRAHLVLVPGFAGFDALGQLEYYAGVTPLLRRWKAEHAEGMGLVLHYFDNLPTASVATRAARLRRYLAQRLARGELQPGEPVTLVGHSTGGLDIRRLVHDLAVEARGGGAPSAVDGARDDAVEVTAQQLLELVRRLVFLSVPQRGTNIADFVRRLPRRLAIDQLRLMVSAGRVHLGNDLEEAVTRGLAGASGAQFLLAMGDALAEMDTAEVRRDPVRLADAQDAAAELELFLAHIAVDFGAIDDLSAGHGPGPESPAHFDDVRRAAELSAWEEWGIARRSYATVGRRPFRFGSGEEVPPWDLLHPSTSPFARLAEGAVEATDLAYRGAYRACAGGPFRAAAGERTATAFPTGAPRTLEDWDNDGIVNTASMLWPDGPETRLVDADHGDVVGHFRLAKVADAGSLRRFHTYDLLGSSSGFGEAEFRALWADVFAFAAG